MEVLERREHLPCVIGIRLIKTTGALFCLCVPPLGDDMWTVTQEIINNRPEYMVLNKATGEKKGRFDSDRNAKDFAEYLNRRDYGDKSKGHNRPY